MKTLKNISTKEVRYISEADEKYFLGKGWVYTTEVPKTENKSNVKEDFFSKKENSKSKYTEEKKSRYESIVTEDE